MHLDLAPHIERLLFHHDTVAVPGLGGFVLQAAAATVDYAGSTVHPPAKSLSFNDNLATDDGLLVSAIAQAEGWSDDVARAEMEASVHQMLMLLNQREIVNLAGIGRLYQNYARKIQFIPDAVNFSRDNYGLPPLQFSPIARSREVNEEGAAATPPAPATSTPAPVATPPAPPTTTSANLLPAYEEQTSSFSWARTLLIVGLLAISAALGYYIWQRQKAKAKAEEKSPIEQVEETTDSTPAAEPTKPASEPATSTTPAKTPPTKVTPQKTAPAPATTQGRECVVVIGLFKNAENIARLKQQITSQGFGVYSAPAKNGGEMVGARFKYKDLSEIQTNIAQLQRVTGEQNIWIKQK